MGLKEIFKDIREGIDNIEKLVTETLEKAQPTRFIDNGDYTVTDPKTGLTWIKDPTALDKKFSKTMTYEDADKACKELNIGGLKDWRLPTREELLTIVDLTRYSPAIDPIFVNTKCSWYWTSTPYAGYSDGAWIVYFANGYTYGDGKAYEYYVRPVRSSQ